MSESDSDSYSDSEHADSRSTSTFDRDIELPTPPVFLYVLSGFAAHLHEKRSPALIAFGLSLSLFQPDNMDELPLGTFNSERYFIRIRHIGPDSCNGTEKLSPKDKEKLPSIARLVTFTSEKSTGAAAETETETKRFLIFGRIFLEKEEKDWAYWLIAIDSRRELYALRAANIAADEREYNDAYYDVYTTEGDHQEKCHITNYLWQLELEALTGMLSSNLFDTTCTQHVVRLGPINILFDALSDPEQELHPRVLEEVVSWESTAAVWGAGWVWRGEERNF